MWRGRLARLTAARYARAAGVALLAAAAVGQVAAQTLTTAQAPVTAATQAAARQDSFPPVLALGHALALGLLALVATVPLAFFRPAMAALAITVGNAVALASFGQVTAAGLVAELTAAGWLGQAGATGDPLAVRWLDGPARRIGLGPGLGKRSRSAVTPGRYLAVGLALPFLVIALTRGGRAAVFLAAAVPVAASLGILAWAEPAGADQVAPRARPSRTRCSRTPRAASGRGSRVSCTTWSRTTSR